MASFDLLLNSKFSGCKRRRVVSYNSISYSDLITTVQLYYSVRFLALVITKSQCDVNRVDWRQLEYCMVAWANENKLHKILLITNIFYQ